MDLALLLTVLIGLLLLAVGTFAALAFYRSPEVPMWITAVVYLAWFLGFASLIMLPLDVAVVHAADDASSDDTEELLVAWKAIYWVTWALAWVLLPSAQEYWAAGDFTWQARLQTAVTKNLRFWGLFVAAGLVFSIYILASGGNFSELGGFVMACSNTYGLVWVLLLLGYGLVEVCRVRLVRRSAPTPENLSISWAAAGANVHLDVHAAPRSAPAAPAAGCPQAH